MHMKTWRQIILYKTTRKR